MAQVNKLKKVSSQLKKSVKAHAKQANIIDGYFRLFSRAHTTYFS